MSISKFTSRNYLKPIRFLFRYILQKRDKYGDIELLHLWHPLCHNVYFQVLMWQTKRAPEHKNKMTENITEFIYFPVKLT